MRIRNESQSGCGYWTTNADALAHLRSCPQGNDSLQFIFSVLLVAHIINPVS